MSRAPYNSGIAQALLEDLDYKQYPSDIRDFVFGAAYDLEALMEHLKDPDSEYTTVLDSLENLITMLQDLEPEMTPEKYFEMLGYGHFKECYYFSPSIVMKLCAERNPTKEEAQILLDAYNNDFDEMFVPSFYAPLPRHLESAKLEKDDDDQEVYDEDNGGWCENPDWHDNSVLTEVCFQLRVAGISQSAPGRDDEFLASPKYWADTLLETCLPSTESPDDWKGLNNACRMWVQSLIERRGVDYARGFAQFCEEFHIWDLHADNVGFRDPDLESPVAMPIILDWMSH